MRHPIWLLVLISVMLGLGLFMVPREFLPNFLRSAGQFRGRNDDFPRPTTYWIETLRDSPDLQERRDATYALAIIGADYGLDREAQDVLPVLLAGMNDQDDVVRQMSVNALRHMGRHAAPAIPALIAEAANREASASDAAVMALGEIGPPAREAVPVLLDVYREKGDAHRRMFAADALRRIDPKAAADAGVR